MEDKVQQLLQDCSKKFDGKFDYSRVVYTKMKAPVEIVCPKHGPFSQSLSYHLNKTPHGCSKCADEFRGKERVEKAAKEFVGKAEKVHGTTYLYDKVDYKHSAQYVLIGCRTHGYFEQTPHNHLLGQGCLECFADSRRKSLDAFVSDAIEVHGSKYDYSEVDYKNSATKVRIRCLDHGIFEQTPSNHLNGVGCPHCCENGYRVNKPGTLYVLKSECGLVKVGITNKKAKERAKHISWSSDKKFTVVLELKFGDGLVPLNIETEVLREMRRLYKTPDQGFNGYSECFKGASVEDVFLLVCTQVSKCLSDTNHFQFKE